MRSKTKVSSIFSSKEGLITDDNVIKLVKAYPGDSGFEIRSSVHETIRPGRFCSIATGIHLKLPIGVEAQIRSKFGLAAKSGWAVLNSPGTVDSGYDGEIRVIVIVINHGLEAFYIKPGDKIAKLVFAEVLPVILEGKFAITADGVSPWLKMATVSGKLVVLLTLLFLAKVVQKVLVLRINFNQN